jgi:predicted phage baseplate assembly protein
MDRDGFVGFVDAAPGRILLKPAAEEDPVISEVAFLSEGADYLSSDRDRTTIELRDPLQNSYDRTTVAINANVARATHGETVGDEVLGSGDGARANQHFALKKPPLTYVSTPTAGGAKSTLDVRVNGVQWQEASSLFELNDRSESYVARSDGAGNTTVIFGDGKKGARLPTGQENVTSTYRSGIGLAGMVGADKLTLLPTRPLGIREVTNPLPATGAAEPEAPKDASVNAPLTVLTLDRIVSLKDFENFARAFAGIGKARAVAFWSGERRLVHVTVAAASGDEVIPTSDLYQSLVRGIEAACDPGQRAEVASYERRTFNLSASILVDARYIVEDVKARVRSELLQAFGFRDREFGQPVTAAEVLKVMHAVEGVEAVDLDHLRLDVSRPDIDESGQPPAILPARVASKVGERTELLLLEPEGINLGDMEP